MSEELQNNEVILKGGLGTVNGREITKTFKGKDGTTALTINPQPSKVIFLNDGNAMDLDEWTNIPYEGHSKTEDAEFEIIEPKQIENKSAIK